MHVIQGEFGVSDCQHALHTLFNVVYTMTRVMASFTPFLTEHMYQNLRHLVDPELTKGQDTNSVHYLMLPQPR